MGKLRVGRTAAFDPIGLTGLACWYALHPLHRLAFAGMLWEPARQAARHAEEEWNE